MTLKKPKTQLSRGLVSPESVKPDALILAADGTITLKVTEVGDTWVKCVCQNSAKLGERKNMNLPGVKVELPVLQEKDKSVGGTVLMLVRSPRPAWLHVGIAPSADPSGHNAFADAVHVQGKAKLEELKDLTDELPPSTSEIAAATAAEEAARSKKERERMLAEVEADAREMPSFDELIRSS